MAEQGSIAGFALAIVREEGRWSCAELSLKSKPGVPDELDAVTKALTKVRSSGALFALVDVDDEFFIIARPSPGGARLLLSDTAAALDYDIAMDVLDELGSEHPDDQDTSVWPTGDLDILADFGLSGDELELIIGQTDLFPDEQLLMVAQRCGFADQFSMALDQL